MHVTGSHRQLAQALAQLVNFTVMLLQILFAADVFTHQKLVVARRLDFQVIIKASDFLQLGITCPAAHCTVQLARLTGRA